MLYNVERHLWRTKDGRLVPTGDLDAWILAYAKGDQIPEEIALREGLISSGVPPEPPPDPVIVEPAVEPVGDVVPSEVAVTTDNPPAELGEQPAVTPAPRKRAARKKVSGVTINRSRSGGTADG
jgi:hypothetical protein